MQLFLKRLSGMANSLDPRSALFADAVVSEIFEYEFIGHLPYAKMRSEPAAKLASMVAILS